MITTEPVMTFEDTTEVITPAGDFEESMVALAASAALSVYEDEGGTLPEEPEDVSPGAEFVIPLMIPTDVESGDGRKLMPGSLSTRELPFSLLWQVQTGDGHNGSYVVGRIDSLELTDKGIENARGVFDTGPYGREVERLVREKMLRGVSADLDNFELVDDDEMEELASQDAEDLSKKMFIKKARVMTCTVLPKPAFQECTIELVNNIPEEEFPVVDGVHEAESNFNDASEAAISSLIASAIPVHPPKEWFDAPNLHKCTPLDIDEDGRVFGHIATWSQDHISYNYSVKPPRSRSNYSYFHTGLVRTDSGEDVAVGQLTLAGGHAPLDATAAKAVEHYDNSKSAMADVHAGEDAYGIWVAGALRPGVTPEQVRSFRASAPSGDWRPINGMLELVACVSVNVPGFPIARARVASGMVTSLVAAGAASLYEMKHENEFKLESRLNKLELDHLNDEKSRLMSLMQPDLDKRHESLVASAEQARAIFAPELDRRVQEHEALVAAADELRSRIGEFRAGIHYKEALHPRHKNGTWRKVLGRLSDILSPDLDGGASEALKRAADAEDVGDTEKVNLAAQDAKASLTKAMLNTNDSTIKSKLESILGDVTKAIVEPDQNKTANELDSSALTEGLRRTIDQLLDELYEKVDPDSKSDRAYRRLKAWVDGSGFESPAELAKLIARLIQKKLQPNAAQ